MENKKSNSKKTNSSTKKKSTTSSGKKTSVSVKNSSKVSATKSVKDLKKIREEEKPKVDLIKVEKKNMEKSIKNFEFMKFVYYAIGVFLIALGVLFNNNLLETNILGIVLGDLVMPTKLIGFIIIGVTGIIQAIKSKEDELLKSVLIVLALALLGSWIFPNGSLSGNSFTDSGSFGINLGDYVSVIYNGIYMCIDKIIMLISIVLFYKIAESTGAYHKVVDYKVKKIKKYENIVPLVMGIIIIILASFVGEIYALLFLLPFCISVLSKLKVDKITSFAVTFGALMIGSIGSPYGTEALSGFNYYASLSTDSALIHRIILQLCLIVLFTLFVSLRKKENINEDVVEESFLTELEYSKINSTPLMVLMLIAAFYLTVGFIDWATIFNVEIFNKIHESLFEFSIGEFAPFVTLLGDVTSASVIGTFTVFDGITVLFVINLLMILAYKISFDKIVNIITETLKYLVKPILFIVLITAVFTVGYITQFMASIAYYIFTLTPEFNPYSNAFVAALAGLFHSDLAFTGYIFSAYFASEFKSVPDALSITYTSISALIQLIVPTSPLLIGLYYTKVSYKSWIKYISLFFAGILVVILILLTVVTYLS